MIENWRDLIHRTFNGQLALRHVWAITQHHRIQASPGYRAAAQYVTDQLTGAGLSPVTHAYPAAPDVRFGSAYSFLEWECEAATLHRLDAGGEPTELLCDFAAVPISVIQRSISVEGDFPVVVLGGTGGKSAADYEGVDVKGKVVLTGEPLARVAEQAITHRGAAGILFDGIQAGNRVNFDLPDALRYTSFWWPGPKTPDGFGFVINQRTGQALRSQLAGGADVRVRARVESRFYRGSLDVVEAFIPGTEEEQEILLVAHLCHPLPSAHDNASGAAALLTVMTTIASLIQSGKLPRPRRGIRAIWVPEFSGTYAWLAAHEQEVMSGRWIAGLNLDMVGADQALTGATWRLVALPQAGAGFADHLINWLRRPLTAGLRWEDVPFEAGSDHMIFSDPHVSVPMPMVIQLPDKFYHTSADTVDKVSELSLSRSGILAADYTYWLAAAGKAEALWLGQLMAARLVAEADRHALEAVQQAAACTDAGERQAAWQSYQERSRFYLEGAQRAFDSLLRLDAAAAAEIPAWRGQVTDRVAAADAWVAATVGADATAPATGDVPAWRAEAERLIPDMCHFGPAEIGNHVQVADQAVRDAYWRLYDMPGPSMHMTSVMIQFWADGRRTVADIADYIAIETGTTADDRVLQVCRLMADLGVIELRRAD